jgi:hypothetical protein
MADHLRGVAVSKMFLCSIALSRARSTLRNSQELRRGEDDSDQRLHSAAKPAGGEIHHNFHIQELS